MRGMGMSHSHQPRELSADPEITLAMDRLLGAFRDAVRVTRKTPIAVMSALANRLESGR